MVPDDPVTAVILVLATAVTALGGMVAFIVRAIVKGQLVSRQVLIDERAENRRILEETKEQARVERERADLAEGQMTALAREQGRTTVALLASIEKRAGQIEGVRDDVVG